MSRTYSDDTRSKPVTGVQAAIFGFNFVSLTYCLGKTMKFYASLNNEKQTAASTSFYLGQHLVIASEGQNCLLLSL